jgi:hypothetical protein
VLGGAAGGLAVRLLSDKASAIVGGLPLLGGRLADMADVVGPAALGAAGALLGRSQSGGLLRSVGFGAALGAVSQLMVQGVPSWRTT